MKTRRLLILLMVVAVLGTTLACGLFSRDEDSPATLEPAVEESVPPEPEDEAEPADDEAESGEGEDAGEGEEITPPADVELGEEYRSAIGGFAFKPIPDYEVEELFGMVSMTAPNADPDLGPIVLIIGGENEEEMTVDDIYEEFNTEMAASEDEVTILQERSIKVDGIEGLLVDLTGIEEGKEAVARVVIVAVSPTQQFTMFASAPKDGWDDLASLLDAVLASVKFFEPEGIDPLDDLPGDDEGGEGGSLEPKDDEGEDEMPDVGGLTDFPTESSELPPGGFAYLLAGQEGFPTVVNGGSIQDQSTTAEFVVGLVSEDQKNSLTLFIPLDAAAGILTMTPYDGGSATKGPGAAIYKGFTLFTNTDGIIMVDAVENSTITGSAYFTAEDEDGNEIAVSVFFNQIPLGGE